MINIFSKFWKAFKSLFTNLATASEEAFEELSGAAQIGGFNGSMIAQIIKDNVNAAEVDIIKLIKQHTELTESQIQSLLAVLRVKYNVPTSDGIIKFLQNKFATITDDTLHNSFASELASVVAIELSDGELNWVTLAFGVGQLIYRKFVKGQDVKVLTDCPQGFKWNGTACVPNVGNPPVSNG